MKQKITLYSCDNSIRCAIRTAFEGIGYDVTEITDAAKMERKGINEERQEGTVGRLNLPNRVDAVVSTSSANKRSEGLAASMALMQNRNDVYLYVLPEAINALRNKLDKLGELVLVGADQSK